MKYKFENGKAFVNGGLESSKYFQIFSIDSGACKFQDVSDTEFKKLLEEKKHPHSREVKMYYFDVPGFAFTMRCCAFCGKFFDLI